jgi:hypothetical protein
MIDPESKRMVSEMAQASEEHELGPSPTHASQGPSPRGDRSGNGTFFSRKRGISRKLAKAPGIEKR